MVPLSLTIRDRVAHLVFAAGKANALDPDTLEALDQGLLEAESKQTTGLVLTGTGKFFSAGLNLPLLLGFDRKQMAACIDRLRQVLLRLVQFPGRTVAAINGHAIAGGAILACACDQRVAASGDHGIGVSEVALGIGLPRVALEVLRRAIPDRLVLEEIVMLGRIYSPEDAKRMHLVHDVVSPDTLIEFCHGRAERFAEAPFATLRQVKHELVAPTVERVMRGGPDQEWLDTWFSEDARRLVNEVVKRLGGS
jgi:enoyl-CoA hydratase